MELLVVKWERKGFGLGPEKLIFRKLPVNIAKNGKEHVRHKGKPTAIA